MEETRQIAEFNESALKIQRLHNHKLDFTKYMENGFLDRARWKLNSMESELKWNAEKIDDESNTKYIEDLNNVNENIEEIDKKIKLFKIRIPNMTEEELKKIYNALIYKYLKEKYEILIEIQQEAGMGSKYKSADEDIMD